ncbi:MFS transporter [Actinacidiphila acidipaludis]|uniref:MFS transporter n=1 Tax=Actinacidiphila acidipaludis TaxID=2873382 RepID=A0ABS7QA81_9ACTN|nr:MFS transporter [Streptomyces acidipaludis]MBY8880026.1 MFS transporter [Streptomyces acidipaludis]
MSTTGTPAPARRTAWTAVLASIGAFVTSLDVVVVSTALPKFQTQLHAGLSDLEWTLNAYNLAFACLMLTGSALGDRFGKKRLYVIGLAVFVAASAACALSGTVGELIAARTVQGCGAALVLPLSLSLISDAFPPGKRGAAIGIWGGITGLGVAAGPVVGGVILQYCAWQWVFWINVPVGVVTLLLCLVRLTESHGNRPQLDVPGVILAAAALFALTWAPVRAPSAGWGSAEVLGSLALGAVLLAAFLLWQRRARHPMLPLGHFRNRAFSTANAVAFLLSFSLIGSLFMVAQMFQTGLGHDPLQTGVRMLVWNGMPMIVAPVAGGLSDRFGNRPFMIVGMLLQGGGLLWLAEEAGPGVGFASLVLPLVVSGIGISMVFPTVAGAVVGSVPAGESGVAAGTNNTVRESGAVFGVAVLAAAFAAHGGYGSPASFMHGFRYAEVVAAVVAFAGALVACLAPGRPGGGAATVGEGPGARAPLAKDRAGVRAVR